MRVRMAPERRSSGTPRSARSLRTARYSVMRSFTSSRPAWSASSTSRACDRIEPLLRALRPRHGEQPVEVGADHRRLGALLAHALEAAQLALGLLAHGVGHAGVGDLRAVLVGHRRLVLAELLADRVHLPAQEVVALLLLGAGLDVLADALAHLELGQPVALELQRQRQALDDVERLRAARPSARRSGRASSRPCRPARRGR